MPVIFLVTVTTFLCLQIFAINFIDVLLLTLSLWINVRGLFSVFYFIYFVRLSHDT